MMDDYFDHSTHAEVSRAREGVMALLSGQDTEEPRGLGIYRQFYLLRRDALACGMPTHLYERFIAELNNPFTAYQDEKRYIMADRPPPLETFLVIRENSSGGVPFAKYACVEKDFRTLPDTVLEHPVIRRLHALAGRLIGWHNDLISLPKDLHRKGDVLNLVRVLQQEHDASLEDAYLMALEFHDRDLREFVVLCDHLPDFGADQDCTRRYAKALGIMIQGAYAWHVENSGRYIPGTYVEPERDSRDFRWHA
ncbi:terpene synthase family protein [Streptomyces sp. IMTB 2501]|uniref:terpene synthase family protein n=1 Tax=Streptomyces sp. IMTB 2501 TaxID=1776340 RepID=UPI00117F6132|nr:terpene synthase family protein [Streptomyces sp. IMTB 2501]